MFNRVALNVKLYTILYILWCVKPPRGMSNFRNKVGQIVKLYILPIFFENF